MLRETNEGIQTDKKKMNVTLFVKYPEMENHCLHILCFLLLSVETFGHDQWSPFYYRYPNYKWTRIFQPFECFKLFSSVRGAIMLSVVDRSGFMRTQELPQYAFWIYKKLTQWST